MKHLRILLVHNYYRIPGGEDAVFRNEQEMLKKAGHQVLVYERRNEEVDGFSKLQKLFIPLASVFSLKTFFEVRNILKKKHIDIVHVHNTLHLISPSVFYAAFSLHIPVVNTLHNFRIQCPGASFYCKGRVCEKCMTRGLGCAVHYGCYRDSKLQSFVSAMILKIHRMLGIYRRVNFICLTDFNREKLLALNGKKKLIDSSKVFVKPNFCEKAPGQAESHTEPYYIYVGRIEKIKGIIPLVKAFEKNQKKLYICGTGELEEKLKAYLTKRHIENIVFKGQLTHNELFPLLAGARALIMPSEWYEGMPMNLVEAFSLMVPAIVSDIGNVGTFVEEGVTGIKFAPRSSKALCVAIDKFEQMDRRKLGENAYKVYEQRYTPEINIKMLEQIYETIISRE